MRERERERNRKRERGRKMEKWMRMKKDDRKQVETLVTRERERLNTSSFLLMLSIPLSSSFFSLSPSFFSLLSLSLSRHPHEFFLFSFKIQYFLLHFPTFFSSSSLHPHLFFLLIFFSIQFDCILFILISFIHS